MAVLSTFRAPSLGHQVHCELMRSALLDLTPIMPATACHQRNYVERYSGYKTGERPRRTGYRPYHNRAIVFTLIETGMRRAAVTHLDLAQVDLDGRRLTVVEKGGAT